MRNSLVKISNKEKHMKLFEHLKKELALCWGLTPKSENLIKTP